MMVETSKSIDTQELAAIFKALSDPNRLAILQMLRDACGGECRFEEGELGKTVSEIAGCCEVGLSTVSHHLKELRQAGLIDCEKRGQWVHCSPNPRALAAVEQFLKG
jgi:ArsR family transcriptional regulator